VLGLHRRPELDAEQVAVRVHEDVAQLVVEPEERPELLDDSAVRVTPKFLSSMSPGKVLLRARSRIASP
jgi:propanediol utilization protein